MLSNSGPYMCVQRYIGRHVSLLCISYKIGVLNGYLNYVYMCLPMDGWQYITRTL